MFKRRCKAILMIDNIGRHGVALSDARPKDVPLATHREYDLTVFNESGEHAATKRLSVWQWVRSRARIGMYSL
jgi:hypothetical protein